MNQNYVKGKIMLLRCLAATVLAAVPSFSFAAVLSFEADVIFEDYEGSPDPFSAPASHLSFELTFDPDATAELNTGSIAYYTSPDQFLQVQVFDAFDQILAVLTSSSPSLFLNNDFGFPSDRFQINEAFGNAPESIGGSVNMIMVLNSTSDWLDGVGLDQLTDERLQNEEYISSGGGLYFNWNGVGHPRTFYAIRTESLQITDGTSDVPTVPLPAGMLLFSTGLVGLIGFRRLKLG